MNQKRALGPLYLICLLPVTLRAFSNNQIVFCSVCEWDYGCEAWSVVCVRVCEDWVLRWVATSSKSQRGLLIFRPGQERRWAVNKESSSESRSTASSDTDSWAKGNYYKTSDFTREPILWRLCVTFNLSKIKDRVQINKRKAQYII